MIVTARAGFRLDINWASRLRHYDLGLAERQYANTMNSPFVVPCRLEFLDLGKVIDYKDEVEQPYIRTIPSQFAMTPSTAFSYASCIHHFLPCTNSLTASVILPSPLGSPISTSPPFPLTSPISTTFLTCPAPSPLRAASLAASHLAFNSLSS